MKDNNSSLYDLDSSDMDYDAGDFDISNVCFDMDCIWDRARKKRLSVLRPLTFILSLVALLGIVGNIFVIAVFSRTRQKRTSTYLVVTLAIIDLIACSVVIPTTLLKEWLFEFKSDIICKLTELMRNSAIISSAMILAAIAFDRFLLVYRKNSQDGNKHVTMAMILATTLTGIALGVPPMLGVGVYMEYIDGGVVNVKVCITNEQLISEEGLQIYWQIITALFSLLIFVIIVLYMLIFIMVYKHTTRVKGSNQTGNKPTMTSLLTKQPFRMTSVLPFVGVSKTRNSVITNPKHKKKNSSFFTGWNPHAKILQLFKNKVSNQNTDKNIVSIKIVQNSATSTDSAIDGSVDFQPQPGPSIQQDQGNTHLLPTNIFQVSNKLSQAKETDPPSQRETHLRHELIMRNRSAHIKTTKVLCIITTVYIIAFLPMFLITHRAMTENEIAFYLYFINNAANPVIYSFMNRKFRQDIWKMFACNDNTVWQG